MVRLLGCVFLIAVSKPWAPRVVVVSTKSSPRLPVQPLTVADAGICVGRLGGNGQDFTSISFTTCLTLGTVLANLPASFFSARVFTLPLRTRVPFFAL